MFPCRSPRLEPSPRWTVRITPLDPRSGGVGSSVVSKSYARVPEALRGVDRNGQTPNQQLSDGLKVIDDQIAGMSAQLAEGDLNLLATRGRFLEIKYREDGMG